MSKDLGVNELSIEESEALMEEAIKLARTDFSVYYALFNNEDTGRYFPELHQLLCSRVQDVLDLGSIRLAVSTPPQVGKSETLSKEFSAWILCAKQCSVAGTGFSHELVVGFSLWIKRRMDDPLHRRIFPEITYGVSQDTQTFWDLSNGSEYRAASTGKKLTGRKVDILIVDDAHSGRAEAESRVQRNKVRTWYDADCLSRLSSDASIILVATRWHPEDLIGQLTSEEYTKEVTDAGFPEEVFDYIEIPALCDDPDTDPLGREEGESIFPQWKDERFFLAKKASVPHYEWVSNYQQSPTTRTSGVVDLENLQKILYDDLLEWDNFADFEWVRGWDLAVSEKQSADFTVGALCGYNKKTKEFVIADIERMKLSWVKYRSRMISTSLGDKDSDFGVQRIMIESVAGFLAVFQDIKQELLGEVQVQKAAPPRGGKMLMAQPWLNSVEAKRVYIVSDKPWKKEFEHELSVFPDGDHDDIIDAISISWMALVGKRTDNHKSPDRGDRRSTANRRTMRR